MIRTPPATDAYREGWERVFGKTVQVECTHPDGATTTQPWPECPTDLKERIQRAGGTLRVKLPLAPQLLTDDELKKVYAKEQR